MYLLSTYPLTRGRRGKAWPCCLWKASQESYIFFSWMKTILGRKIKWFLKKTLEFKIFDLKKKSWNKWINLFLIWKIHDTSHRYIACDNSYIVPKKIKNEMVPYWATIMDKHMFSANKLFLRFLWSKGNEYKSLTQFVITRNSPMNSLWILWCNQSDDHL